MEHRLRTRNLRNRMLLKGHGMLLRIVCQCRDLARDLQAIGGG